MANTVIMPRQGQSVESCIITKLYIDEGHQLEKGDLLFAYETDKASFEEEAKVSGTLLKWLVSEGDEVPVLQPVCYIGEEGEDVEDVEEPACRPGRVDKVERVERVDKVEEVDKVDRLIRISPRARKLAAEKGIKPDMIEGSGPGGRIIVRDIENYEGFAGAVSPGSDYKTESLSNIRKLIAKAMFNSLQNSAQLTHHLGADARKMLSLRKMIKESEAKTGFVNITINDMVNYAVIKALGSFPRVNAHLIGDEMRLYKSVNLGMAVDTERGLMVPSIKDAGSMTIQQLSTASESVAAQCRKGSVDPDIISPESASFTVSNLGAYGVEMFTPVINLPQVAILGVNTIMQRPADTGDGVLGFVPYIGLSLTYDHRALDGGEATRFLKKVALEIENIDFTI